MAKLKNLRNPEQMSVSINAVKKILSAEESRNVVCQALPNSGLTFAAEILDKSFASCELAAIKWGNDNDPLKQLLLRGSEEEQKGE